MSDASPGLRPGYLQNLLLGQILGDQVIILVFQLEQSEYENKSESCTPIWKI